MNSRTLLNTLSGRDAVRAAVRATVRVKYKIIKVITLLIIRNMMKTERVGYSRNGATVSVLRTGYTGVYCIVYHSNANLTLILTITQTLTKFLTCSLSVAQW